MRRPSRCIQGRAHRQQVTERDRVLRSVAGLATEQLGQPYVDARDEPALDRDPEQRPDDRLRAGSGVAQGVAPTVEVLLEEDLATTRRDDARDGTELRELHLGEARRAGGECP